MGKGRLILKRREFIRTGILGSAAISFPVSCLFSSIGVPWSSENAEQITRTETDHTRFYNIAQKYGAEFGAIKPVIRRHRNGRL
jgi:hypothetical protein